MFGVVLWSDEQEQKAVIWCEDHGDLAFYRNTDGTRACELDAGDWVHFEMTMERSQRLAHNPRLIHEGVYPDLADALSSASAGNAHSTPPAGQEKSLSSGRDCAQIIPIAAHLTARHKRAGATQANQA